MHKHIIANAITLADYAPEALAVGPSQSISHAKCVCLLEAGQTAKP